MKVENIFSEAFERLNSKKYKYSNIECVYEDLEILKTLVEKSKEIFTKVEIYNNIEYRYCPVCSTRVNDLDKYCKNCGQRITSIGSDL